MGMRVARACGGGILGLVTSRGGLQAGAGIIRP
jgi:hypothetical protein